MLTPRCVAPYLERQRRGGVVTSFAPITGSVRIELTDVVGLALVRQLKGFALYLVFLAAILAALFWVICRSLGVSPIALWPGDGDPALAGLGASLAWMVAELLAAILLILLCVTILLPWFVLWRMGRERRTFTWIVDENGIKRIDALGAESLLPWSNVVRVRPERRALWLKVKPRGWRYLLSRAFTEEDQERLRQLAARMVSG
jgi:hypothetical protein